MRAVSRLLTEYARERGWPADQTKVYFRPNPEWGKLLVVFVAPVGPENDEEGRYREWESVMDFLERKLADDSELLHAVDLVLHAPDDVERAGIFSVGSSFIEAEN